MGIETTENEFNCFTSSSRQKNEALQTDPASGPAKMSGQLLHENDIMFPSMFTGVSQR